LKLITITIIVFLWCCAINRDFSVPAETFITYKPGKDRFGKPNAAGKIINKKTETGCLQMSEVLDRVV
jgi:hypothetical protein